MVWYVFSGVRVAGLLVVLFRGSWGLVGGFWCGDIFSVCVENFDTSLFGTPFALGTKVAGVLTGQTLGFERPKTGFWSTKLPILTPKHPLFRD